MGASEIFRFTVIRPIQKKDIQETKNFTVPHTPSPSNLESNLPQSYGKCTPVWEEELYILIGQIKRFAHVEEIKGPINRTRAHKTIVGPKLSDLENQQIEDKAIRQTLDDTADVQAIYNGYNYQIIVDADFGFERATQKVDSIAYNFAKEVIDRYTSGITKIVKEQRATITKEINEINSGGIDNDYILSGNEEKYFWIDEICGAQLCSLGKLLRYDTIKPKPAYLISNEGITVEDLQEKWQVVVMGEGRLSVKNNRREVWGVGTKFVKEEDVNRELVIRDEKYIIEKVESFDKVTLNREYAGEDEEEVVYERSVKYVGAPWEHIIPRSSLMVSGRFGSACKRDGTQH